MTRDDTRMTLKIMSASAKALSLLNFDNNQPLPWSSTGPLNHLIDHRAKQRHGCGRACKLLFLCGASLPGDGTHCTAQSGGLANGLAINS